MYDRSMKNALVDTAELDSKRKDLYFTETLFNKDNISYFKIKDNTKHLIDVIPYLAGKMDPIPGIKEGKPVYILIAKIHRRIGVNYGEYFCPTNWNKPCPICEDNKNLRVKFKDSKLSPKEQADIKMKIDNTNFKFYDFLNVVCYDSPEEEKKGVQIFKIADWFFWRKVKLILTKARGGGVVVVADPDVGKGISFTAAVTKSSTSLDGFQLEDRNYKITDDILKQAHCIDDMINLLSYDELAEIYHTGIKDIEENGPREDAPPFDVEEDIIVKPKVEEAKPTLKEEVKEELKSESKDCPSGHKFGHDYDEMSECVDCKARDVCKEEFKSLFSKKR